MADDISLVVGVDYSEMTGLIKTAGQTKRALREVSKDFARTNDQSRYMKSIDKIVKAQSKLDSASRMSRSQIMKLGAAMRQEVQFTDALTASTNRLSNAQLSSNKVMVQTKNRMNGNNMAIQQLGYQVGDFAVQVQGGTSAFVAFSQQGAQLAGLLPMIAGPLGLTMGAAVKLSAVLGILIPVGSALGRMLFEMAGSAKEATDVFKEASDALNNLSSSADRANRPMSDLADRFGKNAAQAKLFLGVISAIEKTKFKAAFSDAADSLKGLFDVGDFTSEGIRALEVAGRAQETILDSLLQAQRDYLEEGDLLAATNLGSQITEARASFQKAFGAINRDVESLAQRLNVLPSVATEFAAILASVGEAKTFEEKGQAALGLSQFIKDNVDVTNNLTEAENKAVLTALELSLQFLEAEDSAEGVVSAAGQISPALQSAIDQANVFASAMERARGASVGIGISTAGINAEIAALEGGASRAEATALAAAETTRQRLKAALPSFEAGTRSDLSIESQAQEVYSSTLEREMANARLRELTKTKGGVGDGGASPFDQNAYLEALQKEADFKQDLVGMTEEQATEAERRREIIKKIQSEGKVADEARIKTILATEAATRSLIEAEEQRQSTMDMVTGHIESAFMSMVDGSKSVEDAFKGMLRAILLEVYQQQVAKPLAQSIGSFLFPNANGNAFSGGSVIPFANGGVVSSATMFPMAGNQTGLMGEAGPEAIMPLKRGANGKLGVQMEGGGQSVVVNQSFNFSANGDDSVKKIIAQAAPQIANMTKKSIMDDRRRGGQMKATFG